MRPDAKNPLAVIVVLIISACGRGSEDLMPLVTPDVSKTEAAIQQQMTAAEQAFRDAIAYASHPDLVGPEYGKLGSLYLAYGIYPAAEPALVNATRLQPDIYRWQYLLGHLYYEMGRTSEAAERFRIALNLQPDRVAGLVTLGLLELDLGNTESAWQLGEEVLALEPENAAGYYITGLAAVQRADFSEAITRLEEALARQPEADFTWNALAQAYRALGRPDDANAAQARAGGQQIGVRDDLKGGLSDLRVGSDAELDRGRDALAEGRVEEAIAHLQRATDLDPERSSARVLLGLAFAEQGDMPRARGVFRKILEGAPDHAATMANIGSTYAREGNDAEAIVWYRRAVEQSPELTDAQIGLARALQRSGDCAGALRHFEHAITLMPAEPRPRLDLATCLSVLGNESGTLRVLEQSVEELPGDNTLRHALAWFLLHTPQTDLRDPERAVELARTVVAAAPTPDVLATLALALAMTGDFDGAVAAQETAVETAGQQGLDAGRREMLTRDLATLRGGEIPTRP